MPVKLPLKLRVTALASLITLVSCAIADREIIKTNRNNNFFIFINLWFLKDETIKSGQPMAMIALINKFRGYTCLFIRIGICFCYTIFKIYPKLPYLCVLKLF
jgi:hypothetical protein